MMLELLGGRVSEGMHVHRCVNQVFWELTTAHPFHALISWLQLFPSSSMTTCSFCCAAACLLHVGCIADHYRMHGEVVLLSSPGPVLPADAVTPVGPHW